MSITTILGLASGLINLAMLFFGWLDTRAKEQIGEDREKLRQFTALQEISKTLKEVDERFDKMTDEEVKDEITKQGDWRD